MAKKSIQTLKEYFKVGKSLPLPRESLRVVAGNNLKFCNYNLFENSIFAVLNL